MKPRKLPSGSWNVRITINGQSYSFTDTNRRECMRMASQFAAECAENRANPPFIDAIRTYIDERAETLSPATIRGYRSIEKTLRANHPALCNKRLVAVTDKDIQAVIKGMSKKTAKNYVGLIQPALGRKFDVILPKSKNKEIPVPTYLEIKGLLRIFENTELEIPIMLGAYGGLRRGEICALTMSDIDGDYVHISKDKVMDEFGGYVVKDPKTESSNRDVLLPHFVTEKIREKGYVTTLTPHQVSCKFQKKQIVLGVDPPYCFHSLRHFSASFLHAQGIPDAYVMSRGGWASPSVMRKVYRHALTDMAREMEQKAAAAFQDPFQVNVADME